MKLALKILFGISTALIGNYAVIDTLLMPDSCYYHTHEPGWLVSLLYDFPIEDNGHAFPSFANFLLTIIIGGGVGVLVWRSGRNSRNHLNQ